MFNLTINEYEAQAVRKIFNLYVEEGYGASKIASMLNDGNIKTKRACKWTVNAVCRILTNEIYVGKIVNGKQEVADFLTGRRTGKDEEEWFVTERPELKIIDPEVFDRAQDIMTARGKTFKLDKERHSNKYLFSTLIKCKDCGWSFRRISHTYKNTYVRWVCSGRNGKGAESCPNATTIEEKELIQVLTEYFANVLSQQKHVKEYVISEFERIYKQRDENIDHEQKLTTELEKLKNSRQKYMDMYTDDLITREELNEKIGGMRKQIEKLENDLKMVSYQINKRDQLEEILNKTFKEIEDITDVSQMTNAQLKKLIQRIEVDKDGNVDIYLRLFGNLGLEITVLIDNNCT